MAGEIFISYRRADEARARLLHAQLRAEGIEAWYDAQVGAGQDWRVATAKALQASRIFVLLFSQAASESEDIAKELAAAIFSKKLVVPVRIENIQPSGAFLYELASRNWVNAFENTEGKLGELAQSLAKLVKAGIADESIIPFDRNAGAKAAARKRKWRRKPILIAAALAVMAASAIAVWLLWPAQRWTIESSRPFVSTLALEGEPAFSPDGKMLAYVSGPDRLSGKIYVRNLAGGDAIKITNDAYNDRSPSWSSDGAHIAFLAHKPGEPCHIMVATVPAGEVREVGRCRKPQTSSVAWQPNSSFLYFNDERDDGGSGIVRLDLDSGARLDIVEANAGAYTSDLRISPDGKSLAYLVHARAVTQLMVRDLTSGKGRILGNIRQSALFAWPNSHAWSADSKTVLATSSSGSGSEIIVFPVDGGAPYRIYASATGISDLSASVGGLLAVESHISRRNLARASPAPIAQPDIIDPASGITYSPTFAPDGTLAFISNRSGTNAIWIMKPGATPAPLFDAGFAGLGRQNFSPDGTLLAVMITTPEKSVKIKILTADGASVASFDVPSSGVDLPTWTPDGKGLIMWDSRIRRAVRVDVADPARRTPVAPPDWQAVTIRSNGTFATRRGKAGVWRIDNGIRLLSSKYPVGWVPSIVFLGDDVLIPDFGAPGGPRILAQPLAGGPDRVIAYAPGAEWLGGQSRMTVNPKTGEIIYPATVQSDSNIDLLTLARR
jgi:Tol biopolymer transport system component